MAETGETNITPVTPGGLVKLDRLLPVDAVVRAWTDPGSNPGWHRKMVRNVHQEMPLLARALDRLAEAR